MSRDFSENVDAIKAEIRRRAQEAFMTFVADAKESIKFGSATTGAPGQPVDTSNLLNSYQDVYPEPMRAIVGTPVVYAPSIEDGVSYAHGEKPLTLRSETGGFHSVKLTHANAGRLFQASVRKVMDSQ